MDLNFLKIIFAIFTIYTSYYATSVNSMSTSKRKFIISTKRVPITQLDQATTSPRERSELTMIEDTRNFLSNNGYDLLNNETESAIKYQKFETFKSFSENRAIKDAIKLVQLFTNIVQSGNLDQETMKKIHQPRCGVPDLRTTRFKALNDDSKGAFSAYKAITNWPRKELTWKLVTSTNDMPQRDVVEAFKRAFQYWADVTPLTFKEVSSNSKSDFVLTFGQYMHGDAYPFDGQGGVLAHAFFPENGNVHFDDAETFTEGGNRGTNLRIVAAHEIGHALGLDHSLTQGALMYPYYTYVEDPVNLLHQDDILGIQSLYGRRNKDPSTTTTTTTTTTTRTSSRTTSTRTRTTTTITTPTKIPTRFTSTKIISTLRPQNVPPCEELNEAVFIGPNNNIYVLLDGTTLWQYDEKVKGWKNSGLLHNTYPKLEVNVRGGVQCKKGFTWFFKNIRVWAYDGSSLLPGFPKIITDFLYPFNPYTAVNKDGTVYILKGNLAWKFDTDKLKVIGYPQRVTDVFRDLPNWMEAAVRYKGEILFFKNQFVYKHDNARKSFVQRTKQNEWPPCVSPKLI